MSCLDRIAPLHRWRPAEFRPFCVDGRRLGRVRYDTAHLLADFPEVFQVDDRAVTLACAATDVAGRSRAVHEVVAALAERGDIRPPRGEVFGVSESWTAPVRLSLDRGMVPLFGVKAFGIHVNGYRRDDDGLKLWIGTRAPDKRVAPGKLDHLVAGGLAQGYGVHETLVKEAREEADLPAELAAAARPVGALTYCCEAEDGLRDDTLFLFDLEVPPEVVPHNTDGELTGFDLWPAESALARVRNSEDFKFNVAPVIIDFALRHGLLHPDRDPDYLEIAAALHRGAPA